MKSSIYTKNLNNPKVNWLDINIEEAIDNILKYFENLKYVELEGYQ